MSVPHRRTIFEGLLNYSPKTPKIGTVAARNYFSDFSRTNSFASWLLHMASTMDVTVEKLSQALLDTSSNAAERTKLEEQRKRRRPMVQVLADNRQFLMEVLLVRHVENYLNYLAELLFGIFSERPETLRSSEKVELEDVLQHETMDEFVRFAAERKVEALSYAPFEGLLNFFADKFRVELFKTPDVPKVVDGIETRNISVHNRCIINARYCKRTGSDRSLIGKRKEIYIDHLSSIVPLLCSSVSDVDLQARSHLKLKAVRFFPKPRIALPPKSLLKTEEGGPPSRSPTGGA